MFTVLPLVFIIAYFQCQKLFWGDTSNLHGTGLATRPGPTAARPLWSCTMVRVPRILEPSCIKYTPLNCLRYSIMNQYWHNVYTLVLPILAQYDRQ